MGKDIQLPDDNSLAVEDKEIIAKIMKQYMLKKL